MPLPASTEALAPPSASQLTSRNPPQSFLNEWINVDSNTMSVRRISIEASGNKIKINMFGACRPTDCDWLEGQQPKPLLTYDYDSDTEMLLVQWIFADNTITQELNIRSDGLLRLFSKLNYTDGSGNLDFDTVDYFVNE